MKRDLARYIVADASREGIAQQWAAIEARLSGQRRSRLLPYSLLLAGAAAVLILYLSRNRAMPQGHWSSELGPQHFALADGSQMQLQADSEVTMLDQREGEVHLQVVRGGARFDVRRDPGRRFEVTAAGVDVVVIGTAFTVALDGAQTVPKVSVERGEVEVRLRQEARLVARLHAGESWPAPAATSEPTTVAAAAPSAATPAMAPAALEAETSRDRTQAPRAAVPRPASPDPRPATDPDPRRLLEQANVARRSGDVAQAAASFEALRSRYPRDPRAALASFELGRLRMDALGDLPGAIEALRHSIALAPEGVFREDAQACLATAFARLRDRPRCEHARRAYLQLYPEGTHAAEMSALDCREKP